MIRIYLALAIVAALGLAGWRVHHSIYQSGYAAAQKADNKALDDAADANAAMQKTLAAAEGAAAECLAGREADSKAAQDAATAADAARKRIASQAANANKKLAELMAGECKAWAELPACGSVP